MIDNGLLLYITVWDDVVKVIEWAHQDFVTMKDIVTIDSRFWMPNLFIFHVLVQWIIEDVYPIRSFKLRVS